MRWIDGLFPPLLETLYDRRGLYVIQKHSDLIAPFKRRAREVSRCYQRTVIDNVDFCVKAVKVLYISSVSDRLNGSWVQPTLIFDVGKQPDVVHTVITLPPRVDQTFRRGPASHKGHRNP